MERLLHVLLSSKALQKFGFAAGAVLLVLYGLNQFGIPYKVTIPIICVLILLLWGYSLFLKGVNKKKASSFDKGLMKDASAPAAGKVSARKAQKEFLDRWKSAVGELKASGLSLYDLPWFLMIGEPQSGKSTTLRKSGLDFPVGTEALSGAGGTRNCDWWFTDDAVILDTAGRFTFQEKNAPDANEWKTFLRLLRVKRPRGGINGVILVIPCSSLLADNDEEREKKAVNIREKLGELQRELAIQFPVFILLTKSDQMLGFTEFFSRLPARDQRQVLGWSMPGPFMQAFEPEKFDDVFDSVHERIHRLQLKLLAEDVNPSVVEKLFLFPEEFRAVREPLHDYLKTIFMRTQYLPPLFFRGFYFTSGLQEGKPIAKACASILRGPSGGGASEIIESLEKAFSTTKAFFIRDFYAKKVSPEKNMIVHSKRNSGVGRKMGMAAIAASALLILFTAGFLGFSLRNLREGVTMIRELGGEVSDKFVSLKEEGENPEVLQVNENWMELSSNFNKKRESDELKKQLNDKGVEKSLREMNWMFFIRNVLYPQSDALEKKVKSLLNDKKPVPVSLYKQYALLWSLNDAWRVHTAGREGSFSPVKERSNFSWKLAYVFDKDLSGDTDDLEVFKEQLESVREQLLLDDLDFTEEPDFGAAKSADDLKANPAIHLDLVKGDSDPRNNEILKNAIEGIQAPEDVTEARIQSIKRSLESEIDRLRSLQADFEAIKEGAGGCFGEYGAIWGEGKDPTPKIEELTGSIISRMDNMERILSEGKEQLRGLNFDEKTLREELKEQLAWTEAAVGKPKERLDAFVDEHLKEYIAARQNKAKTVGDILRGSERIGAFVNVESGELPLLREGHRELRQGLEALSLLVRKQKTRIDLVYDRAPTTKGRIDSLMEDWRGDRDRLTALRWAEDHADPNDPVLLKHIGRETPVPVNNENGGAPAAAKAWRIPDVARKILEMDHRGEESLRVHAWVAYVNAKKPPVLLSDSDVNAAILGKVTVPKGAKANDVQRSREEIDDFIRDLNRELDGIATPPHCKHSKGLLNRCVATLEEIKKADEKNFLAYWNSAYDQWDPDRWLERTNDWQVLTESDYIRDEEKFRDQVSRELRVVKYEMEGYPKEWEAIGTSTSGLSGRIDDFVQAIRKLSEYDRLEAWAMLDSDTRFDRNKTYRMCLENLGKNEKFREAKKVILLLNPEEEFKLKLRAFFTQWEKDLANKFPFELAKGAFVKPPPAVGDYVLDVEQVNLGRLREFLFGDDGVRAIVESPYYKSDWRDKAENKPVKDFFEKCAVLRDYFFEADGKPKAKKIQVDIPGFAEKISGLVSQPSDIALRWKGEFAAAKGQEDLRCHWRRFPKSPDDKYDLVKFFEWSAVQPETLKDHFTIRIMHEADNRTVAIRIPDTFSILSCVYTFSRSRNLGRVTFPIHPEGLEKYELTFEFKLVGDSLPVLPDWSAVKAWTR